MADLTTSLDGVVEDMAEEDWAEDWAVAWTDGDDEIICVKPTAQYDLVQTEELALFMASYGMHLGYGPGPDCVDPQYQFKRME